jgi:hypothetical protein
MTGEIGFTARGAGAAAGVYRPVIVPLAPKAVGSMVSIACLVSQQHADARASRWGCLFLLPKSPCDSSHSIDLPQLYRQTIVDDDKTFLQAAWLFITVVCWPAEICALASHDGAICRFKMCTSSRGSVDWCTEYFMTAYWSRAT